MKYAKSYYAGGSRVVIDGIPIRMARKPSAHNLAWIQAWKKYRAADNLAFFSRAEKAQRVAKQARDDIAAYAEILEITENRAKAIIAQHRAHLAAHPVTDLSLEYDL